MFIILLHETPFYSENLKELFDLIITYEIEWEWYQDEISKDALSLLKSLLIKDPVKRLGSCTPMGINQIKTHPFFNNIPWDALKSRSIPPPLKPKLRVC